MHLSRIKVWAIVIPTIGLLGFELLRHYVVQPALGEQSRHVDEHIISAIILSVAVIGFSLVVFRLLERLHDQLMALNEAGIAVTGDLSVDRVLERVAELARTVAGASFASVVVGAGRQRTVASGVRPSSGERLSLPIVVKGERLGELVLAGPRGGRFRPSDRGALETFAAQAGVALENARLFEQVHELAAARERARIGMDLHDGVIQELYAAGLKAEDASELVSSDPRSAVARMREVHEDVRKVIGDVRTYIYGLRELDQSVDLRPALEYVVAEFPSEEPAVALDLDRDVRLPAATAGNVLHIVREAVANALRHASASSVRIHAASDRGSLVLSVEDDGTGFDPLVPSTGFGLGDMRERAAWCLSEFRVDSALGRGTKVSLSVPIEPAQAKEPVP